MREPQYSILADIQDAIERAKQGKLALYWQRTLSLILITEPTRRTYIT